MTTVLSADAEAMVNAWLRRSLNAHVYEVAKRTPLTRVRALENSLDQRIYLKREDLQPTHSFKVRGASNRVHEIPPQQRIAGAFAASAGNHAQGLALSCRHMGIPCRIYMPERASKIKADAVRSLGAEVVLSGKSVDAGFDVAKQAAEEAGGAFVHAFNDPAIIAGQGTLGLELLSDLPSGPDVVFVPVGGGGLAAGVTAVIKAVRPQVKVIGVEEEGSACLKAALEHGSPFELSYASQFADGISLRRVGDIAFDVLSQLLDGLVTVSVDEICAAVRDTFVATRVVPEPSGAAALAGLKQWSQNNHAQHMVAVLSGANADFNRLSFIAERVERGNQTQRSYCVRFRDTPGTIARMCDHLQEHTVCEIAYRYAGENTDGRMFMSMMQPTTSTGEHASVQDLLPPSDFDMVDVTEDELAFAHLRHLCGGPLPALPPGQTEVLFQLELPNYHHELQTELAVISRKFLVSLCHFRHQTGAADHCLLGLLVMDDDISHCMEWMNGRQYKVRAAQDSAPYRTLLR